MDGREVGVWWVRRAELEGGEALKDTPPRLESL